MTTALDTLQYPQAAMADVGVANVGGGNEITLKIPPNGLLLDVTAVVVTPFDGTTNTLSVGDGTTTFISAVDAKAAANTRYASTVGKFYPTGGTLTISAAETGSTSNGRAIVVPRIVVLDRVNTVHG